MCVNEENGVLQDWVQDESDLDAEDEATDMDTTSYDRYGVDVIITISAIFDNFRRKKIVVFLNNQCHDHFFIT
jgi:galactitol-specific phosphotransferase system IIB component